MFSLLSSPFTLNDIGNFTATATRGGMPDECSCYGKGIVSPTAYSEDPAIDAAYVAEMIRRDAVAAANKIELSVGLAAGGKFAASVCKGTRIYRVGKFGTEREAWLGAQAKANAINAAV